MDSKVSHTEALEELDTAIKNGESNAGRLGDIIAKLQQIGVHEDSESTKYYLKAHRNPTERMFMDSDFMESIDYLAYDHEKYRFIYKNKNQTSRYQTIFTDEDIKIMGIPYHNFNKVRVE